MADIIDIPEDIMKVALEIYRGLHADNYDADCSAVERQEDAEAIAYAILAERNQHYDARWANKAVNDVKAEFAGALWDIRSERQRQVDEEGWTPEHDDKHANGELAEAAACYAISGAGAGYGVGEKIGGLWPWEMAWFKPAYNRRDLIKAAALIVAEIERVDRAEQKNPCIGNFDIEEASLSDEELADATTEPRT